MFYHLWKGIVHRRLPKRFGALLLCALLALSAQLPAASAGWGQESSLSEMLLSAAPVVRIAGDPDTLMVAAWHIPNENYVWISYSTAGGPWSAPMQMPRSQNPLGSLDVAVSPPAGVAVVTWSESVGYFNAGPAKAAIYTTSGGWAAPVTVNTGSATVMDVHCAIDGSGNIVVVWAQNVAFSNFAMLGRSYSLAGGWSGQVQLDTGGSPNQARIGASAAGVFTAAWLQGGRVYARPFTIAGGWGNASGPLDAATASDPVVVVTPDATSIVAWRDYSTNPYSVWAVRNPQGVGWGAPIRFADGSNGTMDLPLLTAGGGGNATLYWPGARGGTVDLLASRVTAAGGWSATFAIDAGSQPVKTARLVSAAGGIMQAVWSQGDSVSVTVWSAAQDASGVWGVPQLVECRLPAASGPDLALSVSGRAVAVWVYSEWETYKLWWNGVDAAASDSLGAFDVTTPSDGASVGSPSVRVAGVARTDASLSVNGQAGAVAADGSFGFLVNLAPGANLLNFTLTMPCGETRTIWLNVAYQVPPDLGPRVDALEAELNATMANVSAAWAAIFGVQSDLQATRANVTSAQAQLALLDARLTALTSQVGDHGTELGAHAADLAMLNASLAGAAAGLAAAEGRLALVEGGVASLESSSGGSNASAAALWAAVGDVHGDLNATDAQLQDARLNLSRLDGQVSTLQATGGTRGVQPAGAEATSALTLLAVAIAAVAVGLLLGRRGARPPQAARDARPLEGRTATAGEEPVKPKDESRAP